MTTSTEPHPLDRRSPDCIKKNFITLNLIQSILEQEIHSYAVENPEDLYDQEHLQIIRKLEFSRGLKQHTIVIAPSGRIRAISKGFPKHLLQDIQQSLQGLEQA